MTWAILPPPSDDPPRRLPPEQSYCETAREPLVLRYLEFWAGMATGLMVATSILEVLQ